MRGFWLVLPVLMCGVDIAFSCPGCPPPTEPTLAESLQRAGGGRGLISICTAGGMGVAAILEHS